MGCSSEEISTLLKVRKPSTNSIYTKIWDKFKMSAVGKGPDPALPSVSLLLDFLQAGLDLGLGLSSPKVQVAPIAATDKRWTEDTLVILFFKAIKKIRLPTKQTFPAWDLSLIPEVLSTQTFASTESASLWNLTLKAKFLIAMTSGIRASELQALGAANEHIAFFPDRVELRTVQHFVPKVSSHSSLLEPWALPTYLPNLESGSLHELDISNILRCYLQATAPFRDSVKSFIILWGKNKGMETTLRTIALWICKLIQKVYRAKGLDPPSVRAHLTRAVSTSWEAKANISVDTICRAATWSSQNLFMQHYRIVSGDLTLVDFGRRTIESD